MEREVVDKIFEAIRTDNLKLFSEFLLGQQNFNISFGKFPLLSVCYLFESYNIIRCYEKKLSSIHNFQIVHEPFEISEKFNKRAKKSLRLFLDAEYVFPIEMLAILDERKTLERNYKLLYKNEQILQNLTKIYNLNEKINIEANYTNIILPRKKLQKFEKLVLSLISIFICFISFFGVFSVSYVSLVSGLGTESRPIVISSESELVAALESGTKYYRLNSDIVLTQNVNVDKFSGTIEGNGYNIDFAGFSSEVLIKSFSGTIKNLTITVSELASESLEISQSYAILAENSTGIIENVSINANINIVSNANDDVYISMFVTNNEGKISNSYVSISGTIYNSGNSNCYFGSFAGINSGTIENSLTSVGTIQADTVDLAGIAADNSGTISTCTNNLLLSQTSSKEWHPNVAGITITNYGTITSCINQGSISSESTLSEFSETSQNSYIYVFAGGISCDNYGTISYCRNFGDITGIGEIALVYVGGITSMNEFYDNYIAEVSYSKSKGKLTAISEAITGQVYVGGLAGRSAGIISNSAFEGEIVVDALDYAFAGGLVGYNYVYATITMSYYFEPEVNFYGGYIQNSYSYSSLSNLKETEENSRICLGGFIGYFSANISGLSLTYFSDIFENCYCVENEDILYAAYISSNGVITGVDSGTFDITMVSSLSEVDSEVLLEDEI